MTALDYILDGLEAELALERELGVRSIEIDRSLLTTPIVDAVSSPRRIEAGGNSTARGGDAAFASHGRGGDTVSTARGRGEDAASTRAGANLLSIAFLHEGPLMPAGVEMMAKIITALGMTEETAKVVVAPPLPPAKAYVVLGSAALKKWFPTAAAAPGQWISTDGGVSALVTYSPAYILRFKTVTPAVKKIKMDMWTAIKSVLRRI